MNPRLTKFSVSNFRSIRGKIDLDLDAPIVLIHGPNGSGKTSLLAALELALTGDVNSLQRGISENNDSLIHVEANCAQIILSCEHPEVQDTPAKISITKQGIKGNHLLTNEQKRFYTERCFLAQSNLSRLLEIYEVNDTKSKASPLTKFVQELLGLDVLDNIIEGMYHLRHVSRLRKSIPRYEEVESELKQTEKLIQKLDTQIEIVEVNRTSKENSLKEIFTEFGVNNELGVRNIAKTILNQNDGTEDAQNKSVLKREVLAAFDLWENISQTPNKSNTEVAENILATEINVLQKWTEKHKDPLIKTLNAADAILGTMPNPSVVGFEQAHTKTIFAVNEELQRLRNQITKIDETKKLYIETREKNEKSVARLNRLDKQTQELSKNAGELASLLSELSSYIIDDECPVCSRKFSEVSAVPLNAHLISHIASLSKMASQLHEVSLERQAAVLVDVSEKRLLDDLRSRLQDDSVRNNTTAAISRLSEIAMSLKNQTIAAQNGEIYRIQMQSASAHLSQLRQNQIALSGLRASIKKFATQLNLEEPKKSDRISDSLLSFLRVIETRISLHQKQLEQRKSIDTLITNLKNDDEEHITLKTKIAELKERLNKFREAWTKMEETKESGKLLADKAISVRTNIVKRVFNESLNTIWEDLFIRLAPDEQFIPAFSFSELEKGRVVPQLDTIFRGGNKKGNPRSMLSSGNLNTAALTLFLSLHLSVKPQLPWLVIDDPVQSMDEIHIAQFAALLRTLSKQQDRQTIIAVHERSLFDYLALELSPASEGDRLVTVELSRSHNQDTNCVYNMKTWHPDSILKRPAVV